MRIFAILALLLFGKLIIAQDYFDDRLFIKIKDENRSVYSLERDARFNKVVPRAIVKSILPVSKHPLLSNTYELILKGNYVLDSLIFKIQQLEQIDYVEKVPLYKLFFTPNDPLYSTQWNLAKIQADLAWNLGQGCTQVKIAVTDDGFLMNHEDLVNQWHINTAELSGIAGVDDDGNGYIDDWRGWDAANNDNDPSATAPTNSFFTHGTHVAGIVAAQTHNSKGIAAIGYNCKMIPVKIGASPSSSLTGAFQGLDYSINASGCDVINMSWGGGAWSATFQALFNIAKSKGIICVAAAGNSNTSTPMYPASYNHVISVAASGSSDTRASFSNFGSTIDVTAPGVGIPSCLAGSITSYGNLSGTSMASPLVAGLCGLMKCYNPMPSDSIEACLKRTCDNINTQNPSFIGQLGAGRINAFQALQCLTKKPKSDFISLDTFQCPTKAVRYQAKSFGIPTLTYQWSFPGGSPATSTIANPVVTYATAGLKSATLITCNSLGCDTMTKLNYVNIDTPKAWLNNRVYTTINAMSVAVAIHFKGTPPFAVTLTEGSNTWTQSNIRSNPYLFSIQPKKDTSILSISSFSDSSCVGNRYGQDTIFRITSANGATQYCESSFQFNGAPTNTVVKIDAKNGAAWKDLYSTNGFTWECWFNIGNRTSVSGLESVVTASDAMLCEDIGFIFNMPWSGGTGFGWVVSGQTGCSAPRGVIATTMSFSPNTWYHAAGVMDYATNTMRLFVNGVQVNSGTLTIPMSQRMKNNVAVTIGNQDVNYNPYHTFTPFNGKVDEVRFWNTVRTATEIQANYKQCLAANTSNLVAYFKADEGTGTITASKINGNFEGTLQNGAAWSAQVDSVKNCNSCGSSFCRDSLEVTSAQSGWQALQTNGTWGSLSSCNYVTSIFTANAANFPGMTFGNCLWGPVVSAPSRTYYNSSSQTTTSTSNADITIFRKELTVPAGAEIDSVRLWMLSDDFVDSVFINSKNIYTTPIPITYGQVLFTKKEVSIGTALTTNYITIKAGDLGGNYGHYFRMKVYYRKVCGTSTPKCIDSTVIFTDTSWQYQNTSGTWVPATLGINTCGQYAHATWSPSVLIGLTNQNQMIWGSIGSSPSTVRKQITFPDKSLIDSIRIKIQADDNVLSMKINGTTITSTPFGWNNISNIVVNNSSLVNGVNNFTLEGVNSGACAWLAMKMVIYTRKDCGSDCDTSQLNTGKVLHLDFNGNTQDKSGNNNHATNFGATPVAGKDGVANTAYRFDSTNYMSVAHHSSLNLRSFTITAILKPLKFNTDICYTNCVVSKGTAAVGAQWAMQYAPTTSTTCFNRDTSNCNMFLCGNVCPPSNSITNTLPYMVHNKWECAVLTYDSITKDVKMYMNGVLRHQWNATFTSLTSQNAAAVLIGKYGDPNYPGHIQAIIDDIRIYNRALAPAEVKGYCGTCNSAPPPPSDCDTSRRFTHTQCLNDSLEVTLRAGSQYQWSPKMGLSSDTVRNPKIYVTANQRYLVSYIGTKGCQVIDTIDISVRPSAIYPKMDDQLICIGDSVQMTIPIYATNVQWSPNTNISSITANNPYFYPSVNTTYYLQFRDTFGCLHKDTFIVHTKVCCPARARFSIPKELLCFGEDLTITNRSKGPITGYNWNFGNAIPNSFAGANPPVLKFPAGGTYSLRLIVTNGICFDTMTKIVTVVQVFPNAGKDTTNCLGAFVTDLGESPISDWTYKWTPTIYLDDPNIANPKCSIVNDSVNYVVEVTDRNSGCKAYDTVVVYTNRSIDSTAQNLRICNGDSVLFNGIQRKTTGNYYFTIKKADGFCDSFINILRLNVLQKQVIPLDTLPKCEQYIDAKGKKHTQSFIEYDTIRSKSILNCDSMVYIRHVYIYKKVYRDRPPVSGCAPFRYNGKTYAESKMRVDSLVIRNIYLPGCDTIEYINVIVFPKPKAVITPSIPNPVLYKQTVTLSASGGQRYFWLQTGSTNQDIDYKINNTQPKLFTVRVTDKNDCWDTVSYLVKGILPDTCYYGFPNVFSPNQDNLNDEYIPNMDECTEVIVFAIYDRWGEKVFETNQLKGWNGYFKGRPAPMGVYLYYAEFSTPWGIRKHKGTFTLMR